MGLKKELIFSSNNEVKVSIQDHFWSSYIDLVRNVVIPYQWQALNDEIEGAEPSHAIKNFQIAAGLEEGEHYGMVFQDSDVAKWMEAVGYLLAKESDYELEALADCVIDVIAAAQQPDGYLNTYYTVKEPDKRWSNLCECHELYCAGHMIEAAVAYFLGTGKRKLLDVVIRLADYIDTVFGPEPHQIQGYDGHQEIELALVKLYRVTGNERYLKLSTYFLEQRGQGDFYLDEYEKRGRSTFWPAINVIHDKKYSQTHVPIREQHSAEGHAVRAVYMATGIADVAIESKDQSLVETCQRLWNNIVNKRMYITGGIGSMAYGESFSLDYDLPNDTVYAETCASIGLIFFAQRMLQIAPKSEYADVLERALYNTVIAGMSKDGKHFFYVNPLEVWPEACGINHNYEHVKPERQGWFGCACCPPNIARLLASLDQYMYTIQDNRLYTHLYIGGDAELIVGGQSVTLHQSSNLPWEGRVHFTVRTTNSVTFTLALRVPDWSQGAELKINGQPVDWKEAIDNGYACIHREWLPNDEVEWVLCMPVLRMKGHPLLRESIGKVAIQRGPLVYCLEEADNGKQLHQLRLQASTEAIVTMNPELLGGIGTLQIPGLRDCNEQWGDALYKPNEEFMQEPIMATFIPYFAWANRGLGEMSVWVRD
ncbi:beta-L-arabinofuranosidase domain-containing protein [Paenibacillus oryzisoli]|uniref:glycoside hydrolase family 127 protein n=1 Tax=Paenibacillus oryzisoli TaxID=1850517 RepID=UPI003D2B2895